MSHKFLKFFVYLESEMSGRSLADLATCLDLSNEVSHAALWNQQVVIKSNLKVAAPSGVSFHVSTLTKIHRMGE